MALWLLNFYAPPCVTEVDDHGGMWRHGVSRLLSYSIEFSPQVDEFTVLSHDPDHILWSVMVLSADSRHGVPGLRPVEAEPDGEWLLFRHLPTGARLRFRYFSRGNPRLRKPPWFVSTNWREACRHPKLFEQEKAALDSVPPMHDDAEVLLAGLVARLWTWSEPEQWAVSGLIWDDLRRTCHPQDDDILYLWGHGADWVIRWGGDTAVPPSDVARAMTHELIGIEGATPTFIDEHHAEVRYGRATLRLERRCHDLRPFRCGEQRCVQTRGGQ
jgi:hypothetical protein